MNGRPIELLRGAWGGALLMAPARMLGAVGAAAGPRATGVTRVLGARQLTQAALSGVRPSPEILAMGVWVDVAHAASAVGLAVADRGRARAGLIDAVIASTWAVLGRRALRRADPAPPGHDRARDTLARAVLGFVPGGGSLLHEAAARRS